MSDRGPEPLDARVAAYVSNSYPHNLDFRVVRGALKPCWKLRRRFGRLRKLYAEPHDELLDLSSSKGFFVLEAAQQAQCQRTLGIDVHAPDLHASQAVARHLGLDKATFEPLLASQLAERIDEFGGPFRTVLLLNTYQYLYFGSERSEDHTPDHSELFRRLARVTAERLIFSNRVEFERLPRHIQRRAREAGLERGYDEGAIRAAADEFFTIEPERPLGRIPLWVLRRR